MKLTPLAVVVLLLVPLPALQAADAPAKRPNILFILADDLGYADTGFSGGKTIKTPALDKLAREGAVLDSFYVQPVCSPTRAALMTGRYAVRTGVYTVVRPGAAWGLPLAERTLAGALRDAGYETVICGKWHLGEFQPGYQPTHRGFDHQYGPWFGMIDYFTHKRDGVMDWHREDQPSNDEGYSTHLLATEACRRIREKSPDKPLFLYLPFNAVHAPHQVPASYTAPYDKLTGPRRAYAGMVAAMDEAIGQVVAALEEKGLLDNTLVIFSSDNGGPRPGRVTDNGPFRAGKGTLYEGGVRVCAFATWPGRIEAGQHIREPLHIVDWYPTLLKLCGGSVEQKLPLDGRDIWPVLTAKAESPHDTLLLCGMRGPRPAALRAGDWKLLVGASEVDAEEAPDNARPASDTIELYNLAADPGEKSNLAAAHPEKVKELRARLEALTASAVPTGSTPLRLSLPRDYQVHQRTARAEGKIIVAGTVPKALAGPGLVEARLIGAGAAEGWQKLTTIEPGATEFRAELGAPAGGWYRLEVRVKRQNTVAAETAVEHVGVGEVFVIAGQSNSANHGEEKQTTRTGRVAAFDGMNWQPARDPQPGASGGGGSFLPPFGDALADQLKVPVGIVAIGVGATSVREWLPRGVPFPNPPTLMGHVTPLPSGGWESKGILFSNLNARLKQFGPRGFRAVLWHQGESDANQKDPTRTLPGDLYRSFLERIIRDSRREAGWEVPWFVAQVSYHTPEDTGSPDIRAAQKALWDSGVALAGPDSDALSGELREGGGKGVHFSGPGLREHAARWVEKVAPWLEQQVANAAPPAVPAPSKVRAAPSRLALPNTENFTVAERPAFLFLPPEAKRAKPQPWIFYAPTLSAYPDEAERWMHEQFLAAGIAVVGVDVGEAYGSPKSHVHFDSLHRELTGKRGFAAKPCLLGRSRGGLWVSSWAIANPARVAGLAGIYPVFDFRTYPGLEKAAPAYGLTLDQLTARAGELNPIERIGVLASAGVPAALIHGDVDKVVPLKENSAEFVRRYREAGAGSLVKLMVLEGQGHNMFEGFFHSQELVDFAIARARAGAQP